MLPITPKRGSPLTFGVWHPDDQLIPEPFGTVRPIGPLATPAAAGTVHLDVTLASYRTALPAKAFTRKQVPVSLTASGRASPVMKLSDVDAENIKLWGDIPAVADYQKLGALRPAATTLLEAVVEDKHLPLLVTQPFGRGIITLDERVPRLDEIKARLDQLGPKPAANAPPEGADVTKEREEQQKLFEVVNPKRLWAGHLAPALVGHRGF